MSTETKHTPGPWIVNEDGRWVRSAVVDRVVADPPVPDHMQSEDEANLRLIAAAPELLTVAQRVAVGPCRCHEYEGGIKCLPCTARAALAKAEGPTHG